MNYRIAGLALALFMVGCKRHREPGPDTTVVDTSATTDTATTTDRGGRVAIARDTFGVGDDFDVTAAESLLAHPPRIRGATSIAGLTYGLTGVEPGMLCNWPLNGNMLSVTPSNVQTVLKVAKTCNTRHVIVASRRLITTTGENHSPLSMAKAKAVTKAIADQLTPSFLDTYGRYLIGYNLADDYGSTAQWGGKIVTQAEIAEWATYARGVFDNRVALGVRVEPQWILKGSSGVISTLKSKLDYVWCQYRTTKGDFGTYVNRCTTQADGLGLKAVMGINVRYIGKEGGPVATPSQVRTYETAIVKNPKTCASLSWKWDTDGSTWTNDLKAAHVEVAAVAKAQPARSCRKGTAVADGGPPDSLAPDTGTATPSETIAVPVAETALAPEHGHKRR